jgi:hypothetical protein
MMGASSHQWIVKRSRSTGRAANRPAWAFSLLSLPVLLLAAVVLLGCGAEDPIRCGVDGCGGNGMGGAGGAPSSGTGVVHVCVDGDVGECHFELPQQGDIINCFSGTKTCVGGVWGPCADGKVSSMSPQKLPPSDDARLANVPGEMPHNYPADSPPPAMCNPITSCVHDWCKVGVSLNAACDPCVASICAASPDCCAAGGWTQACVDQVQTVCNLSCFRDPCNPSCQNFNKVPPAGGFVLPGFQITPWDSGSDTSISAWVGKGTKEPCTSANDCQFDQYCNLPVTNGSLHDKCATGVALTTTPAAPSVNNDPCVDKICSLYPNCCSTGTTGTCSHNRCVTGTPLVPACDLCVTAICAVHPQCCGLLGGTAWDATCVSEVTSICGQTCNSWDAGCVSKVHDTCGVFCYTPPITAPPAGCEHDKCYSGSKLNAGACTDPCVAQICLANPNCCNVAWDASCVLAAGTICSSPCPLKGNCEPWLGGQKDGLCPTKPDLTVGIPCNTKIPICNVGGVEAVGTALAPIILSIAPAASATMPSCSKDGTAKDCPPFIGTIAPGQCVDLDCPLWADMSGGEIIVNANGTINECNSTPGAASCNGINTNNWSISGTATSCEPPICTGTKASNPIRALSMHIMVERSASSGAPAAKWTGILTGVANYLQTASNAGGPKAAVQFFPDGPPEVSPPATAAPNACTTTVCATQPSSQCIVRTNPASGNYTLKNLPWTNPPNPLTPVNVLTTLKTVTTSAGLAPTSFAYDGALNNIVAKPVGGYAGDRNIVLILTSDITTCGGNIASLAGQASDAFQNKRSRTWVIGVGTAPGLFDKISLAGGTDASSLGIGANKSFTVASGDDVSLTNILKAIQGGYVLCSYPLPPLNLFDSSNPKVEIINSDSTVATTMTKVVNAAGCSPVAPPAPYQYYYDDNNAPQKILLCPATCTQIRTSAFINKAVKITLNCPGTFDDSVPLTEVYASKCPNGTKVQWGFLTYDTIEPLGTSTDIRVRVSDDINAFGLLPPAAGAPAYVPLLTATQGPPDTQQCLLPPNALPPMLCTVDLFNKLGGLPAAGLDNLELSFVRHTNIAKSKTPTINGWQITYSCPDSN